MLIAHTTVAGATTVTNKKKKTVILNYKSLLKLQKVSKQVTKYIKGPSDIMQTQL